MTLVRTACLFVLVFGASCTQPPAPAIPPRLLGNPVTDALAALARGDSTYLAIDAREVFLPGLELSASSADSLPTFRLFSQRSLGVSSRAWRAQRDSLTVYAAAYNAIVHKAATAPPPAKKTR